MAGMLWPAGAQEAGGPWECLQVTCESWMLQHVHEAVQGVRVLCALVTALNPIHLHDEGGIRRVGCAAAGRRTLG